MENVIYRFGTEILKWKSRPSLLNDAPLLVTSKVYRMFVSSALSEHIKIQKKTVRLKGPPFPLFEPQGS
jgi:hypothetical protein